MKARVKATGVIVNVTHAHNITSGGFVIKRFYKDQLGNEYSDIELEFLQEEEYIPDYWTHLEHQAAIGAMQGILGNQTYTRHLLENSTSAKDARNIIVDASYYLAHSFVEKLKKNSESNIL